MSYKRIAAGRIKPWSIILEKGADVIESLEAVAAEENIRAGVIVSAVGSLKKAVLRNPKTQTVTESQFAVKREIPCPIAPKGEIGIMELSGEMEVLSLEGNITVKEGKAIAHVHASVYNKGETFGGSLCPGSFVYRQLELCLLEYEDIDIIRVPSPDGFFNTEIKKKT